MGYLVGLCFGSQCPGLESGRGGFRLDRDGLDLADSEAEGDEMDQWDFENGRSTRHRAFYVINRFFWADDIILIARSFEQVRRMASQVIEALERHGLTWKKGTLHCMAKCFAVVEADEGENVEVESVHWAQSLELERADALIILGIKLDREGSASASFDHRMEEAVNYWHGRYEQLCSRKAMFRARCKLFYSTVMATLLYGRGVRVESKSGE